ncbi:MAG: sulfotransferase family protein [Gammaproteobacteria bacterium]|nr:sulfotransferase family protein [Gammaproteobacteria bacterium]
MVFHEHKCIYFHIGKTAGVSVERWLRDERRDARIADHTSMFGWDAQEGVYLQHATPKVIQRKVGQDTFDSYYKFTVVRNPFARLVSVYYYLYDQHVKQFGTFENYVESLPSLVTAKACERGSHHIPQVNYTQIDGENICDHIAHFETLPDSLNPVRQQLDLAIPLPKHNVYRHKARTNLSIGSYYTPSMLGIVLQIYSRDFEAFGYSNDPGHLQPGEMSTPSQK